MAYIVPSILVQQTLATLGGVSTATPNLEACIIGPTYNILTYTPGSLASQISTAAKSTTSTTGSALVNTSVITVASTAGFTVGDSILIPGAGSGASTLQATILGITGNVLSLDSVVVTTITSGLVYKTGKLTNTLVNNTFTLPGQLPGQVIDTASINVWLDSALVETLSSTFNVAPSSSVITSVLNPANLNATTNTLRAEPGDRVTLTYMDTSVVPVAIVFSSTIRSVVTSSGLNGTITSLTLVDSLPANLLAQVSTVSVRKTYNNQLVPVTNPIAGTNINTSATGTTGQVVLNAGIALIYGPVISANVFVAYRALRTDLSNTVLTITSADLTGQLKDTTDANPLGLACSIALSNTAGRVRAIAIASNDIKGYTDALTIAEGERLYFLAPLTQDPAIISVYKMHSLSMSTAVNASWRVTLANTAMPLIQDIGQYSAALPSPATSVVALSGLSYVLTDPTATFLSDGVTPGDVITFVAGTGGALSPYTVLNVVSNQQLVVSAVAAFTGVSYHITRTMSKTQTAAAVASFSTSMGTSRVIHVQPDTVGISINGVVKYLPGYYLCAGLAGMGTGFAVQQGFTNVGIAGISDLRHSNFYFSKQDLNTMAAAGTCLFVQDTQGGVPYCRHELTTDMSSLNTREILKVKELDFLSYFYVDKLKSFIGSWNITTSSLNTLRQSIVASSELLISQKLPKIGSVLVNYNLAVLQQDPINQDHVQCTISVAVGTPLNFVDLSLVV